jgi:RimJ/RimL family protein N-acetyltransferase
VSVSIRRAHAGEAAFFLALVLHEDIEPFLGAVSAKDPGAVAAEIERSERDPHDFGRFVIEVDGERAGAMGFELANRRSRVAHLERLAVHPSFRGRRLADEAARQFQLHLVRDLGYHRLELEIYGFNERAIVHAERAGFVREGVRRRAYWRHGGWTDAVLFGLVADELDVSANILLLHDYLRAHNEAARSGVWDSSRDWFADGAELAVGALDADEVVTFAAQEADGEVSADYGLRGNPTVVVGRLLLRSADGRTISRFAVSGP